jgi:hypothetical protein
VVETAGRLYVDGFMVDESDWTRVHGDRDLARRFIQCFPQFSSEFEEFYGPLEQGGSHA